MSNTRNDQRRLRLEAGRIAGLIDEHRRRAHSTPSVPEKVQLITALSALRKAQTRLVAMLLPTPESSTSLELSTTDAGSGASSTLTAQA